MRGQARFSRPFGANGSHENWFVHFEKGNWNYDHSGDPGQHHIPARFDGDCGRGKTCVWQRNWFLNIHGLFSLTGGADGEEGQTIDSAGFQSWRAGLLLGMSIIATFIVPLTDDIFGDGERLRVIGIEPKSQTAQVGRRET